jgi:hypothetical protein
LTKKIVKLNGGLGNQMFQYAFACALKEKTDAQILFDFSYFEENVQEENVVIRPFELNAFNTDCPNATINDLSKIERNKPNKNVVTQISAYKFDKKLFNADKYYYDGYFQNEKYFKEVRDTLLNSFSIKDPIDNKNQLILDNISQTNSVSIHVRRGDYISLESANKFHGACSLKYYEKAIKYIAKKVKNPHFFLFSDDIEWVIENLKIEYPYTVIDFNQNKGWLDLNLMKHCKHNILANSSFSWWGAWLNENPEKIVVAPKKWIAGYNRCDIVPRNWVKK